MRILLFPVLCILCAPSLARAADPARWLGCESSDDCILARGACGAATAVNRAFRGAFEKKAKSAPCRETVDFKLDRKHKGAGCSIDGKCVTNTLSNDAAK